MNRFLGSIVAAGVLMTAPAFASFEDEEHHVRCSGIQIPFTDFYLSYDFLEGDGSGRTVEGCGHGDAPVQGRIYVTDHDGGAVAADGERDTPAGLAGWVRVNGDGSVTCYDGGYAGGDPDSKTGDGNFRGLDCAFIFIQ